MAMQRSFKDFLSENPYCFSSIDDHIASQKQIISTIQAQSFSEFDIELIAPTFHQGDTDKPGVLLLHGLLDSTAIMQSLAEHFKAQNHTVFNLLLPGHGTKPADLLSIRYQDWLSASACAIDALNKTHSSLIVVGLSTGVILASYLATLGAKIDALISYAPAFSLKLPQSLILKVHQLLCHYGLLQTPWLSKQRERSPYKYSSICANCVSELTTLNRLTKAKLSHSPLTFPVLNIVSEHDETISTSDAIRYLPLSANDKNRLIYYTTHPKPSTHNRLNIKSRIDSQHISNFSHVCMPVSPQHPVFGEKQFSQTQKRGAITLLNQIFQTTKRLTYNPHFDKMTSYVDNFVSTLCKE